MNPIVSVYTAVLWQPLYNGLIFFYHVLPGHDLGLAIVALTVVIRLILAPLLWRGQRSQRELALLQPEVKKIQEKFKKDREAQGKAMMELYASHRVNPFSGCLTLVLQLPILIALLQVFNHGLDASSLTYLYSFVARPETIRAVAFGFLDLAKGNLYLGAVAALTQFVQTKLASPPTPPPTGGRGAGGEAQGVDFTRALQWQTTYFFPLIILFWSYSLPAALTLYWTVMNVFGIVEQFILQGSVKKVMASLVWNRKAS